MNDTPLSLPAPRGSSFYAAMRILPRDKRQAMFDIYGFCRAVDDIADDCARPREARRAELQAWRADIDAIFAGRAPPRLSGLARSIATYDLQRKDFLAVIDGMAMDVEADIRAPDWPTLDLYCDRVACAVGRLSTRIFGLEARLGDPLAEHLGRALQLTNILRDLDEDCTLGRLYLPREALDKEPASAATIPPPRWLRPLSTRPRAPAGRGGAAPVRPRQGRSWTPVPRAAGARAPAPDGGGLWGVPRAARSARLRAAARAGAAHSRARLLLALAWYGLF